jgi:hypothetical protein
MRYFVSTCAIGGFVALVLSIGMGQTHTVAATKGFRSVDYQIGKSFQTLENVPTLIVQVSVKSKAFNRSDMIELAKELKERFDDEPKLFARVFDSYSSARDFVPHPHSRTYDRDNKSLRGYYSLDRKSRKEYIQFSSAPGKPRDEIEIDLTDK